MALFRSSVKPSRQDVLTGILLACLMFAGCRPKGPPPALIAGGTVVLLKCGSTNAAFVVTKQNASPEVVDYTWFLRSDRKSTFDPKSPLVASGSVEGAKSIVFGPFNIQWSTAGSEDGYVYYPSRYRWFKTPWGKYLAIKVPGGPFMAV